MFLIASYTCSSGTLTSRIPCDQFYSSLFGNFIFYWLSKAIICEDCWSYYYYIEVLFSSSYYWVIFSAPPNKPNLSMITIIYLHTLELCASRNLINLPVFF